MYSGSKNQLPTEKSAELAALVSLAHPSCCNKMGHPMLKSCVMIHVCYDSYQKKTRHGLCCNGRVVEQGIREATLNVVDGSAFCTVGKLRAGCVVVVAVTLCTADSFVRRWVGTLEPRAETKRYHRVRLVRFPRLAQTSNVVRSSGNEYRLCVRGKSARSRVSVITKNSLKKLILIISHISDVVLGAVFLLFGFW